MSRHAIVIAAWICHGTLLAAVVAGLASAAFALGLRAALAAAAAAPLIAAIPGLYRERRYTYQWLALVLVVYVGAAAVEVVASLGASVLASLALLAALVELGLLFALSRSSPTPTRGTHE